MGWPRFASAVQKARWFVFAGWLAAAAAALLWFPPIERAGGGALGALVPERAEAVEAELRSKREFAFPLLSRTLLVQRDPGGLSALQQLSAVRRAGRLARGEVPGFRHVRGALPLTNALGAAPFSRERSTAIVTYLFIDPALGMEARRNLARRLNALTVSRPGQFVGTTGLAPARAEQSRLVADRLPLIELATVLLVALAVGLRFRALGAPLLTLVAVATAYLISSRTVAWVGQQAGFAVPQEVEPVMVVLVFGVVTDYAIFFLSRFRSCLADGRPPRESARRATTELAPIIFTAGITIVAATATLLLAELDFLRVFGPGLAFSVLVSLLVALTFIPAGLGIFRSSLFWPRRPQSPPDHEEPVPRAPRGMATFGARRPWLTIAVCGALLIVASVGLLRIEFNNPIIRGLPADSEPRQAYRQAAAGFAPGVLSPTVLVLSDEGITQRRAQLAALQRRLRAQPGVAAVVGPAQQPVAGLRLGATFAKNGDAVRYFMVASTDPLGARAINRLRRLQERLPAMLRAVGLAGVDAAFAGDTALSAETIDKTADDLRRVAPAALLVMFLITAVFLRALIAPLYLLLASVAAFAAALGLAGFFFQDVLDHGGITYFVPFASAVLLVSLGCDYNVFLVGRIWQEAGRRPLRQAVPIAASAASRSITLAGLILASSFALLVLIPVRAFAELAFVMTVGLLLDTFLVRTLLVPALVTVVGERSGWPGRSVRARHTPAPGG